MLSCPRCSVVHCVRYRGDDVCCSVMFGTLVVVFSGIWSELLMTSAISCLVISVRVPESGVCIHISGED